MMRSINIPVAVGVLLCGVAGRLIAQEAKVTPLMTKELPDIPGKEGRMLLVEYPPGSKASPTGTTRTRSFMC